MNELRIFIADDEAPARARLKELLSDIRGELATTVVGESASGLEVIDRLPASAAQVLLLDIQMPGIGGIELARHLCALENAVYHGVEPGTGVGDVLVRIERRGDRVLVLIENPWHEPGTGTRAGSHMALDNIRERLMLFFDDEARLYSRVVDARYRVEIEIPYRSGSGATTDAEAA